MRSTHDGPLLLKILLACLLVDIALVVGIVRFVAWCFS